MSLGILGRKEDVSGEHVVPEVSVRTLRLCPLWMLTSTLV